MLVPVERVRRVLEPELVVERAVAREEDARAFAVVAAASLSLQQRNEIMQSIQRFVNSLQKIFYLPSAPFPAQTPTTAAPQTLANTALAARFVLRGGEY